MTASELRHTVDALEEELAHVQRTIRISDRAEVDWRVCDRAVWSARLAADRVRAGRLEARLCELRAELRVPVAASRTET